MILGKGFLTPFDGDFGVLGILGPDFFIFAISESFQKVRRRLDCHREDRFHHVVL
jgi:hypothetical protein